MTAAAIGTGCAVALWLFAKRLREAGAPTLANLMNLFGVLCGIGALCDLTMRLAA